MFRGRYEHTIDAKGRTSVPARYRDVLNAAGERRIVITTALESYLMAFTPAEWTAFEDRLGRQPMFDLRVQKLKRIFVSGAVDLEIDDVGRVSLPPTLREHARLKKDVIWAGAGRYAELWDKDEWSRTLETTAEERREISSRLAELGL